MSHAQDTAYQSDRYAIARLTTDERRAALVAGLRELADFLEWHGEIPVPTYPDFVISVGQSDEWTKDTAEGAARMEAVAAALGVEVEYGTHYSAERQFSGLRFRAYFIPKEADDAAE